MTTKDTIITQAERDEIWAKIQKRLSTQRNHTVTSYYEALPNPATLDLVDSHLQKVAAELAELRDVSADGGAFSEDHREFHQHLKLAAELAREMTSCSSTLIHLVNKALELAAEIQDSDDKCQGCGGTRKVHGSLAACPWCTGPARFWCSKCGHSFSAPARALPWMGNPYPCPQCGTCMEMERTETGPKRP